MLARVSSIRKINQSMSTLAAIVGSYKPSKAYSELRHYTLTNALSTRNNWKCSYSIS